MHVTSVNQVSTLTKIFSITPCVGLHSGSRHLTTHRKVRVGSKTGDLLGKTWKTRVLAGR